MDLILRVDGKEEFAIYAAPAGKTESALLTSIFQHTRCALQKNPSLNRSQIASREHETEKSVGDRVSNSNRKEYCRRLSGKAGFSLSFSF